MLPMSRVTAKDLDRAVIYLNGVDISDRCFEADAAEGWIHIYEVDSAGHKVMLLPFGDGQPAWECVQGDIRVEPRE